MDIHGCKLQASTYHRNSKDNEFSTMFIPKSLNEPISYIINDHNGIKKWNVNCTTPLPLKI